MEWKDFTKEKPEDDRLFTLTNGGYAEIVYIENNEVKKPWRYDSNDLPVFKINHEFLKWRYLDLPKY